MHPSTIIYLRKVTIEPKSPSRQADVSTLSPEMVSAGVEALIFATAGFGLSDMAESIVQDVFLAMRQAQASQQSEERRSQPS
jgi:hypothetical protein